MARRSSRAPLIAGVDMFVCFAVVLFIILGQPQAQIDQQIAHKEEQLALLDKAVEHRREERQAVEAQTKQAQEEAKVLQAQLASEIASTREQLAQRKRDFEDWDILVDRFTRYSDGSARNPSVHVYLRPNGIYTASNPKMKLNKNALHAWLLQKVAEYVRQNPATTDEKASTLYVAFYIENGANDSYRSAMSVIDNINHDQLRVSSDFVTLPSGVVAGKGSHLQSENGGAP